VYDAYDVRELPELLRRLTRKDKLAFKKHALLRMYQREVLVEEVKEALLNSEVIESYTSDKPLPSFLVLGYTLKRRPLHVVFALDLEGEMIWIITVYQPSDEEWEEGFRKRRGKI